jgi:ankyrin repeat protein
MYLAVPDELRPEMLFAAAVERFPGLVPIHPKIRGFVEPKAAPPSPRKKRVDDLFAATAEGDVRVVRSALAGGIAVDARDDAARNTPLVLAAMKGHRALAIALLRAGAAVNAKNDFGQTALYFAAHEGDAVLVRALLRRGARVNAREHTGLTPLFVAVLQGRTTTVKVLLARGADPNAKRNDGSTPIFGAGLRGRTKEAALLLRAGARAEAVDRNGWTPLETAVSRGAGGVVRALLDNAPDLSKEPALLLAAAEGHLAIAKLLVARGADPRWRSPRGNEPLALARRKRRKIVAAWLTSILRRADRGTRRRGASR